MFNKFFYDQFSESSSLIYNTDISFESDNDFNIDFSPSRVRALLAAINTNKACGPDEIPGMVLKMCSDSLALPLSIIYKLVYNTRSLPLEWKLSNIVLIFKKGDSKEVSNYRPISLLCIASKIMERIIHEEITINKVMPLMGGGGGNPIFAHPQILISMYLGEKCAKMGKKVYGKRGKK